jgi:hypothetical protein
MGLTNETDQIRALIDQEIEELDAFLLSDDGLENAMDVSGLDQCSPSKTVESDISIWANGDFSIWRLQ